MPVGGGELRSPARSALACGPPRAREQQPATVGKEGRTRRCERPVRRSPVTLPPLRENGELLSNRAMKEGSCVRGGRLPGSRRLPVPPVVVGRFPAAYGRHFSCRCAPHTRMTSDELAAAHGVTARPGRSSEQSNASSVMSGIKAPPRAIAQVGTALFFSRCSERVALSVDCCSPASRMDN